MMKDLNKYIFEKLKINKDIKFVDYEKVINTIKDILNYIFSTKCSNNASYRNVKLNEDWFKFSVDNEENWICMKFTDKFFKKYKSSDTYNLFCLISEHKKEFGIEHMSISRRVADYTLIFKNWKFKDE